MGNKGINVKNIQVNELDKQTFNTKFDFDPGSVLSRFGGFQGDPRES